MTRPTKDDIEDYAARIRGAASHDGYPARLTNADAQLLATAYGLDIEPDPVVRSLKDVATQIATQLLEGNHHA